VTENVGDYGVPGRTSYGVVAVLENGPGPTVMVRTDLDGLPVVENTGLPYASRVKTEANGVEVGVMHACGHDLHMTSFLGTARLLSRLRDHWSGTLVLIGQPAEERGSGAKAMLDGGLYTRFPKPDYAVALHTNAAIPAGTIGYREGYALANVDSVDITIRGAGGHGAYPHTTKDPIVIAAEVVMALQTIVSREVAPIDPAVVTVGSFHAGTKHNIIPDQAHLQLTVRSYKPEVRRKVLAAIERITRGIAVAAGVPEDRAPIVKIAQEEYTPSTYNDPELTRRLAPVLQQALGSQNVIEVDPVMGGEDFSRYGLDTGVPIFMFWLGAVDPARHREAQEKGLTLPSLHSSGFAPLPETAIRTGVKAMTAAALNLLEK
jgi:hippurate hydrolase